MLACSEAQDEEGGEGLPWPRLVDDGGRNQKRPISGVRRRQALPLGSFSTPTGSIATMAGGRGAREGPFWRQVKHQRGDGQQ